MKWVLLFGGDFLGFSCGFYVNDNWIAVEIDPVDKEIKVFIREKLHELNAA